MKKELEKTQNISISAIIFIILVIIGILNFNKPENVFNKDKSLPISHIEKQDYIINQTTLDSYNSVALVDLRAPFEFERGSLPNAINIYTPDLLDANQKKQLEDFAKNNKTIILFGANPNQANGAWLFLTQIGYKNVKILSVSLSYDSQNKLIINDCTLEKPAVDYAEFITKAKSENGIPEKKLATPKKVIKLNKTKKKAVRGGC
jgi:rhodanese-related sulfurtransferase